MEKPVRLNPDQAQKKLPPKSTLKVVRVVGDQDLPAVWTRQEVLERFESVGVEVAGVEAWKRGYGLASVGQHDTVFVEHTNG